MAAYKDEQVHALFAPNLQPGEQLVHWAYGVKLPNFFIILISGSLLTYFMTKHYLAGLTTHGRFIVMQMTGGKKLKGVTPYQLGQIQGVKTSTGPIFTHIKIAAPVPFVAKFHRMGMKQNREHSMAMAAALEGKQIAA